MSKNCSFEFVLLHTAVSGVTEGLTATAKVIKDKLRWTTMYADIKAFVQSCLVCTLSASGSKVPRPLGQQIQATRVSELLQFRFPLYRRVLHWH